MKHKGQDRFVHSSYVSTDGRRIVQISPNASAIKGDGILCTNVPVSELEEVKEEGPGESSGDAAPV